ncbi:caspase domain-containing protein [Coprinopsis sp. MPI-PUGE-AT-0042]|nr:caspase domain-containing protein [Coprinopsis sp. MPI-PUGE-AT-0042]
MSASAKSNIHALVLGINRYQSNDFDDLQAAVNDANSFEQLLLDKLNVPSSQIINLRDEKASRQNILKALTDDLLRITSDCKDPAIIIYYAGHGASIEKPKGWEFWATNSNNIELLCPSDMGLPLGQDGTDVVDGIPDRTICRLLNKLSRARGNNITLILDCCHSAGINRNTTSPVPAGYIPRRIQRPPPLSARVDESIYEAAIDDRAARLTANPAGSFAGRFQDSHVLMAACGREQTAFEFQGSGLFTQSLLSALEACGVLTTTYDGLLPRISMGKWQTPHFEGNNMNRLLFNAKGSRSDPFLVAGHAKIGNGVATFVLDAGTAQGIMENSHFDIYTTNLLDMGNGGQVNPRIGTMIATRVDAFTSQLEFPPGPRFEVPAHFFARWGDYDQLPIQLFSEDKEWLQGLFPADVQTTQGVRLVDEKAQASLTLTLEGDMIYFDRNDALAQPYIGTRFPKGIHATESHAVYEVIRRWRKFNHHLTRPSPLELPMVRMELHYLKENGSDDWGDPTYEPTGKNLLAVEPATVELEGDFIGVTIYNEGDIPLYPFLFYFDPNDLTIVLWKSTPLGAGDGKYLAKKVDSPLPPHSRLPLGYGNGGSPWELILDDKEKDVGFFRLFVSTLPANFNSLEQSTSAFPDKGETQGLASRGQADQDKGLLDADKWGSKTYTLVQTKKSC